MASLKSKDCSATNMRSLMKVALAQIVRSSSAGVTASGGDKRPNSGNSSDSDSEDGDESRDASASKVGRKMSLLGLKAWYNNQVPKTAARRPPVVFVFEDFEGFHPSLLQDFIHNLR